MLKLRTDIGYVANGKLTQAGVEAIQGQMDAKASTADLTALETAVDARLDALEVPSRRILLATRTASASATLDFTEFNNVTYKRYEFEIEFLLPATDNTDLWLRTSTNGGSSYDAGASDYSRFVHGGTASGIGLGPGGSENDSKIGVCSGVGNAANEFGVCADLQLIGAANSATFTIARGWVSYTDASANSIYVDTNGFRKTAADVDAVRFLFSSGNITSGVIRMYGLT